MGIKANRKSQVEAQNLRCISPLNEALPGVMGNRGIMSFILGEQGNTSLKMKGTGEQM